MSADNQRTPNFLDTLMQMMHGDPEQQQAAIGDLDQIMGFFGSIDTMSPIQFLQGIDMIIQQYPGMLFNEEFKPWVSQSLVQLLVNRPDQLFSRATLYPAVVQLPIFDEEAMQSLTETSENIQDWFSENSFAERSKWREHIKRDPTYVDSLVELTDADRVGPDDPRWNPNVHPGPPER